MQNTSVLQIGLAPSPVPNGSRITPPQTRVRSAVRIDRRRMIMRFHFKANVIIIVEFDDPRVVGEDADDPFGFEHARRLEDRMF